MFDNVAKLRFTKGAADEPIATAMVSSEGEEMEYKAPVTAEGRVEDWMTNVLNEMRHTNRKLTKEAVFYYQHQKSRSVLSIAANLKLKSKI